MCLLLFTPSTQAAYLWHNLLSTSHHSLLGLWLCTKLPVGTRLISACAPVWGIGYQKSFLQSSRSWARRSSYPHVRPILRRSASRSLHQVFLGRLLFLFSLWFQVRACLVVLFAGLQRVCPIHFQRLWRVLSPQIAVSLFATVLRCWSCLASGPWRSF